MALGNNLKQSKDQVKADLSESSEKTTTNPQDVTKDADIEKGKESLEEASNLKQYCVFKAGKEEYAIPIEIVKEVVKYSDPSSIPQMPNYIIGMSNVRGNIYGVMDLEVYFRGTTSDQIHKYLLVLDHDVYKMGIRISDVPSSLIVSEEMIEELGSASLKSVIGQKYLKGIIKKDRRMIILFDILGMVSSENFTEIHA